jgi:hypothetical protein
MEEYLFLILGIVIVILVYKFNENKVKEVSEFDNRIYQVNEMSNKQDAANRIAQIRDKLSALQDCLNKNYPDDPRTKRLNERLNLDNIKETPINSDYTSFSVNKGEELSFCVRDKGDPKKIHDLNLLVFVAMHEIAHVVSESIGHGSEFLENFAWVLRQAIKCGIYIKEDFASNPKMYCGVKITNGII